MTNGLKYAIECLNLSKKYPDGTQAVKGVTLRIPKNTLTTILGPNGAGKTTLLNMIAGVTPPTAGSVRILGENPWASRRSRALLGFVPQEGGVWPRLSVYENLMMAAALYDIPSKEAKARARELIDAFGLKDHVKRVVAKLSGGLRRRLSLAMALMHDPPVVVLDEPTTGLDPGIRLDFMNLLREMLKDGKTVLMTTHISEDTEFSDKVIVMNEGLIVAEGTADKLRLKALGATSIIEVTVALREHVTKAHKLLTGLAEKAYVVQPLTIVCHVRDPGEALPRVFKALEGAGIDVKEVKVRKPSLSDVFRALTGRSLEEPLEGGG